MPRVSRMRPQTPGSKQSNMPKNPTFGEIEELLGSLGFEERTFPGHVVFEYAGGSPMILLPHYEKRGIVRPIHLQAIKGTLLDSGLIGPEDVRTVIDTRGDSDAARPPETKKRGGSPPA
jgi:hypothetical protein